MDRQAIKREFPIGGESAKDGRLYDPVTAAAIITAGAATYGAVEARETRIDQEKAIKKSEDTARKAQAEQEKVAFTEKKAADTKLEEQRARILKGQRGRGGLLFGSELGVNNADMKQTLGA